jgi:hypothetical protein
MLTEFGKRHYGHGPAADRSILGRLKAYQAKSQAYGRLLARIAGIRRI